MSNLLPVTEVEIFSKGATYKEQYLKTTWAQYLIQAYLSPKNVSIHHFVYCTSLGWLKAVCRLCPCCSWRDSGGENNLL
jgi:hypothetical protein